MSVASGGGGCGLSWSHDVFHSIINEVSYVPVLAAQRCTIINTRRLFRNKGATEVTHTHLHPINYIILK